MSKLLKNAGQKLQTRKIDIVCYEYDTNHILVESKLIDKRNQKYYLLTGDEKEAGLLHNMTVRILIEIPKLIIRDIEVDMVTFPRDECAETGDFFKSLIGMRIEQGFSLKIKSMFRGVKGCAHLVNLMIQSGPAAVQGMWALLSQKPVNEQNAEQKGIRTGMARLLKDTCYAWRGDGESYKVLVDLLDRI